MAFPDPEAITVPEYTRPVATIRTLEDVLLVTAPPLTVEITASFRNRLIVAEGVSGGGSSGSCEDDRPDTGMLYPRG